MKALDNGIQEDLTNLERKILSREVPVPFKIPKEFYGLLEKSRKCVDCPADIAHVKQLIIKTLENEE